MNLWLPNIYDYLAGQQPVGTTKTLIGWLQQVAIWLIYFIGLVVVALVVRTIVVQLIV